MGWCAGEGALFGVDLTNGGIVDTYANFVWEPAVVKVGRGSLLALTPGTILQVLR